MPDPLRGSLTAEQFRRVRAIFEAALEQPLAGRSAWLEVACGGDTMLAGHVERMLMAADHQHPLLDLGPGDTGQDASLVCAGCAASILASHVFCPSCGTPTTGVGPSHEGRFRAGALFAGRFRIVALQGRGGMGQVYRAHDLELGQPVALKFLTAARSSQRARNRLRTEVRLARQISHPNVCRVHDIGDAHGELYLSMEYVDGEDLATLFKRIGRLPVHKGVDIARKLCAGLAAAHAKGVLHRDLKPGNIMLDTHGEVRITDFGLAGVAGQLDAAEARSGTAAYMAPEQLEGRDATARSDIYALGLVLFELFTGRAAFAGTDAAEFLRLRGSPPPTIPSTLVRDLDSNIERTILQCLEPDPRMRPASALEVARSLPGGDPLAEALAAGETPSPDLVAAAGPDFVMRPAVAVALLVMTGAALTGILLLTERTQMVSMVPMENSPEVLASKAREVVRGLGYRVRRPHVAYGFRQEDGYLDYVGALVSAGGSSRAQWKEMLRARPSPVSFWYAQSDTPLVPPAASTGTATPIDSWRGVSAAVSVDLDLDGQLLRIVASEVRPPLVSTADRDIDWQPLFTAAGLDRRMFTLRPPEPGLAAGSNSRVTWTGAYPGRPDIRVRIEGVANAGAVTSFEVLFPWTKRDAILPERTHYQFAMLLIVIWIAPGIVARFNWRTGRADVRAALRIGAVVFFALLGSMLLNADDALNSFVTRPVLWVALGLGAWAAMVYIALEPWVRRWWPYTMIGWARVMAGRWRDPIVARDVLVALALITGFRCLYLGVVALGIRDGAFPLGVASIDAVPGEFVLSHIAGLQFTAANILSSVTFGIATAAVSCFLLALFRSALRSQWLGVSAFCMFSYCWTAMQPGFRGEWPTQATYLIFLAIWVYAALRYGLLALVTATCAYQVIAQSVLGTDLGSWHGRSSLIAMLLVAGIAIWAFRVSIGNRSLVRADIAGP